MQLSIRPKSALRLLLAIILALLAAHMLAMFLKYKWGYDRAYNFVPLFDMGAERNIPSFYSSLAIFLCAGLLALIGAGIRRIGEPSAAWLGLAAIFAFLSVDEAVSLHERLAIPVRETLGVSGIFRFAWVIPYGVALVALAMIYLPFLLRLPARSRNLFILAGGLYVGGALGMELVGGYLADTQGMENAIYAGAVTIEEVLEKVGIALFAYALLDYASEHMRGLRVAIEGEPARRPSSALAGVA